MIRKNIRVSITTNENNSEETLLDIKSSNNRKELILEPKAEKLAINIQELKEAILIVDEFSELNPTEESIHENVMMVEFGVDNEHVNGL